MWLVNHSGVHVCATLRPFLSTKDIQEDQVSTYSQASNKQAGPFAIGDSEVQTLLPLYRCIRLIVNANPRRSMFL